MRISPEKLAAEAEATEFRADMLEKAVRLLELLETLHSHPFLKVSFLKGGTALNLFVFDVPRLSVDIDLNYVGTRQRDAMLEERPRIEKAVQDVFRREDFTVRRMPEEHAGGKWLLRYQSASGVSGNLDVDVPRSLVAHYQDGFPIAWKLAGDIPVMDIHDGREALRAWRAAGRGTCSTAHLLHGRSRPDHRFRRLWRHGP